MTFSEQNNELGLILSIQRRPSEEALASAYLLLNSQDLLPLIWHWRKPPVLSEFLEYAKRPDVIYYALYAQAIDTQFPSIAGLGWAIDITDIGEGVSRANVGQAFLRNFWKYDVARELAGFCISDGFDHCGIGIMYGMTPTPNRAAIRFVKKMGFEKLAVLPKYGVFSARTCDILASCMTKERWG